MQTKNFTQKLLRQRGFLRSLLPLFALFVGLGASQKALAQGPAVDDVELILSQQPTGASATTVHYAGSGALDAPYTGYPKLGSANPSPVTSPPNLGTYDLVGTSALTLTGSSLVAEPIVIRSVSYSPTAARVSYRVYLSGTTSANLPSFTTLTLNNAGAFPGYPAATLFNITTNINLLSSVLSGGQYVIEANFEADYPNGTQYAVGNPYSATFSVTSPPITPTGGTTIWQGDATRPNSGGRDWRLASNWSNGVPTATSNAIIPQRPTCPTQGCTPPPIVYPILDDPTYDYAVNNLTLQGQSNSTRGELEIQLATLTVYGNLRQNAGGLNGTVTGIRGVQSQALNSTIIFAGTNQVITGVLAVPDILIRGSGIKSVTGVMRPTNTLNFQPASATNGVIVQSAFEDTSSGTLTPYFDTTLLALVDLEINAIINPAYPETNTSYILGVSRAIRPITAGVQNAFGNIGLDLTANYTVSGVTVFRIVGDPLQSPTCPSCPAGTAVKVPIKRQYIVSNTLDSDDPRYPGAAFTSVVFHYLNSAFELNGIPEQNLTMFRSIGNGPPYQPVFGTLNMGNKTVTRANLNSLPNFVLTLGDKINPLPVSLASFDAKRVGANAVVTWQTASEQNSKGFNVQVSTDGREFRTLEFVASASPNSTSARNYSYTDMEPNKSGMRYYRLQQVDVDGKSAFFAPRMVSFEGSYSTTAYNIEAYPNPFTDHVSLNLTSTVEGKGSVSISDITGRTIEVRPVGFVSGSNAVEFPSLGKLKSGIYLLRIAMPNGATQNVKVVKE